MTHYIPCISYIATVDPFSLRYACGIPFLSLPGAFLKLNKMLLTCITDEPV